MILIINNDMTFRMRKKKNNEIIQKLEIKHYIIENYFLSKNRQQSNSSWSNIVIKSSNGYV